MDVSDLIEIVTDVHEFDILEIKCKLDFYSIQYDQDEGRERLKHLLLKFLLIEILKSDSVNKEYFSDKLQVTLDFLRLQAASGYPCFLIGCRFWSEDHRKYVRHVKRCHPTSSNIICNFRKSCTRRFSNFDDLLQHIKQQHSKNVEHKMSKAVSLPISVDVGCKCDRISCGNKKFGNTQDLMTHYNSFHASEDRVCIFHQCKVKFNASCPKSAFNHFRLKHKKPGLLVLKPQYLLELESDIDVQSPTPSSLECQAESFNTEDRDSQEEMYDADVLCVLENDSLECQFEGNSNYYLEFYADFLNRLVHVKFIPQSTVQEIAEGFIMNTKKSLNRQESLLRSILDAKGSDKCEIDEIIKQVIKNDPFLKAQEMLNSEYKRIKFIQDQDQYVSPREILLNKSEVLNGAKKDVYHYIPIIESLKVLHGDVTFQEILKRNMMNRSMKIRDIKDGLHYSKNQYFKTNPDAYGIMLYSDAVEIVNPLGAARGTYKLVQVFYTLCDIEKAQRSKIDRLQLVMIFREKLLKKYSLKNILKPLILDLKLLEAGVDVSNPVPKKIKAGLVCYIADNLEASVIGGFSSNFSSKDICRICHFQYHHLESDMSKAHEYWSIEEYDLLCANDANIIDNQLEDNSIDEHGVVHEDTIFDTSADLQESSEDEEETEYGSFVQKTFLEVRPPLSQQIKSVKVIVVYNY